jgi:septal ring factor EnvC (AmiA/AmiB activator)
MGVDQIGRRLGVESIVRPEGLAHFFLRLGGVEIRLEDKFEGVETRMKVLETEIAEVKTRIGKIEWEAESVEKRVSSLENSTRNDGQKWDRQIMASEERNLTTEVRIIKLEKMRRRRRRREVRVLRIDLCSRRSLLLDHIK